jgi:FixJ family two-component response regulator
LPCRDIVANAIREGAEVSLHIHWFSLMLTQQQTGFSMPKPIHVAVVDDDESVRESLPDLLREFGYTAEAFASAESFLASSDGRKADCLILDFAMPRMSGLDLQAELTRLGQRIPTVFITAHGGEGVRRTVRERGAVECLVKPFSDTALLAALKAALKAT